MNAIIGKNSLIWDFKNRKIKSILTLPIDDVKTRRKWRVYSILNFDSFNELHYLADYAGQDISNWFQFIEILNLILKNFLEL